MPGVMQSKWILFCLEQGGKQSLVFWFFCGETQTFSKQRDLSLQPGAPPGHSRLINFLERLGLMGAGSGKGEKEKRKPHEI